jgi:hypothetical protein
VAGRMPAVIRTARLNCTEVRRAGFVKTMGSGPTLSKIGGLDTDGYRDAAPRPRPSRMTN